MLEKKMSEKGFVEIIKQKIIDALEESKFQAYSDIKADSRSLHGNASVVVNFSNAKAIVEHVIDNFEFAKVVGDGVGEAGS